ncbi:MAG: DUF4143 domain-containing protein [Succinivibrio sp.]|nr:DUF4143 domain-containing protein [Succinivibrio sp.]
MERLVLTKLLEWKNSEYRKPLHLKGARGVGKTWLLKEFGNRYYQNTAYFNFEESPKYKQFFETTKDVHRILDNLIMASDQIIEKKNTLIIFDEIQVCPNVINSLKYFCENAPEYHLACTVSQDFKTSPSAFPVGKVDFLQINPMTFTEFLLANKDLNLVNFMDSIDEITPIADAFFNPLYEKLKMYFVTGGMPKPVLMWTEKRDVAKIQSSQTKILKAYEADFKKLKVSLGQKCSLIYKSVPTQLNGNNKKFIFKAVKEGARKREYETALHYLENYQLVHKIYRCNKPNLPIAAFDDLSAFKIYLSDVGILRRLSQLDTSAFIEGNRLFTEFKGALSENYVLQALVNQFEVTPRYWSQNNPPYEVDFLIQRANDIFPIEVKAETNTKAASLKKYKELFKEQTKLRVRFSLDNLRLDEDMLNIPLFLADKADKLIGLALKQRQL